MKNYSTRKKILDLLANRRSITVIELSRLLKLTKADVRYQLKSLLDDGFIQKTPPVVDHPEPGRPAATFSLSSKNLPPIVAKVYGWYRVLAGAS